MSDTSGLRRAGPKRTYQRTHQGVIVSNPGSHTYKCGMCNQPSTAALGRWKHRVLGFCCPKCKP
jgi:hypothetical protein